MSALKEMTGFHEFAEFVAEDVGTVDSGLNSVVLANKDEMVLLPLNEPTFGTKRKSQIQTYLEQNKGEGVQHMALFTPNIFQTLQKMKAATRWGGLEFMEPQPKSYYESIRNRIGDSLTDEQYAMIEKLGLLADKDDKEGILLQIFTKPIGDRPTLFLEIIQRIGCVDKGQQKPGCGGFGKGNFRDLFKSIEDYEKTLKI
jgi:4-hydroxyphenylpyruvate dioxygenase